MNKTISLVGAILGIILGACIMYIGFGLSSSNGFWGDAVGKFSLIIDLIGLLMIGVSCYILYSDRSQN